MQHINTRRGQNEDILNVTLGSTYSYQSDFGVKDRSPDEIPESDVK